jgi:hypothetical protein
MRQRTRDHAALISITCFGLLFLFCCSLMNSARSGAIEVLQTSGTTCKVDIANGKEKDCILHIANDDRIAWYNSSSHDRSVRFKPNDNPFGGKHCWDVPANTPQDPGVPSGKIKANALKKDYTSSTYDVPCGTNPPSDAIRGTPKVTIQ